MGQSFQVHTVTPSPAPPWVRGDGKYLNSLRFLIPFAGNYLKSLEEGFKTLAETRKPVPNSWFQE